ncbi:hypothetical protein [Devosia sp. SL43]|uniref:hypothetical protein n=1 Tax=Devosia sp. SL43 TaxID=2806348 RepID=UPI001F45F467|nr:hypothetical protein [Devosia sp. SL43]UJW87905.1 hypothetical protein IM737_20705 [Devosia sp. SL43]
MKVSITDQIQFATTMRDSFANLVSEGVKSTNGMSMETKLDLAEAILLTLHAWAAYEPEIKGQAK